MYALWISWRLLVERKRAFCIITIGIVLSVALLIIAQAQMQNLEQFFVRTVLGSDGAIQLGDRLQDTIISHAHHQINIQSTREGKLYVKGIEHPEAIKDAIQQFSGIRGLSEILEGPVRLSTNLDSQTAQLYGVDWRVHFPLSNIDEQLIYGFAESFQMNQLGILIGDGLSRRLGLRVGDWMTIASAFEHKRYQIVGIYQTGIDSIDNQRVYSHLSEARWLMHQPYGGVYFQITLDHPQQAPVLAKRLEDALGHQALSWQEREQVWLDVFLMVRIGSIVLISMVMFLAGMSIFNSLALLVLEKQKDIGILRAMGYTQNQVRRIFLIQGLILYGLGLGLGSALATLVLWTLKKSSWHIQGLMVQHLGSWSPQWVDYQGAAWLLAGVILVASMLPAHRAASLAPGKIIRSASL